MYVQGCLFSALLHLEGAWPGLLQHCNPPSASMAWVFLLPLPLTMAAAKPVSASAGTSPAEGGVVVAAAEAQNRPTTYP